MSKKNLFEINLGAKAKPMRAIIMGPSAIGKTTGACEMPNPLLLQVEDGMVLQTDPNVQNTNLIETYDDFIAWLDHIIENDDFKDRKTLVIDSLDWLENLIKADVCAKHGKQSIGDFEWGTGYAKATATLDEVFDRLNVLREQRKMRIVFICHAKEQKQEKADLPVYYKYDLKLGSGFGEKCKEYVDAVLFYNYEVGFVKTQDDKGSLATKVTQSKDRYLFTQDTVRHYAKNRYNLPEKIKIEKGKFWETLSAEITKAMKGGS